MIALMKLLETRLLLLRKSKLAKLMEKPSISQLLYPFLSMVN